MSPMPLLPHQLAPLLDHPLRRAVLTAARGTRCHLVGGAIRDLYLLGHSRQDWDLLAAEPRSTARRLAENLGGRALRLGGERFELFRVVSPAGTLDLQAALAPTFEAEMRRRDLTINAIALDLDSGELADPIGGVADLETRRLRQASESSFDDDPLRVLRLLRFATTLPRVSTDEETVEAARVAAPSLERIAPERVREELRKVMSSDHRASAGTDPWLTATRLDLYPRIWNPDAAPEAVGAPRHADLDRSLAMVETATGWTASADDLESLRHASLLIAAASPGHPPTSTELVERRWVSKRVGRQVDRLLTAIEEPTSEVACRRWLARFAAAWPAACTLAIWRAPADGRTTWPATLDTLSRTVSEEGESLWSGRAPLDGNELRRAFGLEEGPLLGRLIGALRDAHVEGAITTPEEALDWAGRWLARESGGSRESSGPRRPAG